MNKARISYSQLENFTHGALARTRKGNGTTFVPLVYRDFAAVLKEMMFQGWKPGIATRELFTDEDLSQLLPYCWLCFPNWSKDRIEGVAGAVMSMSDG